MYFSTEILLLIILIIVVAIGISNYFMFNNSANNVPYNSTNSYNKVPNPYNQQTNYQNPYQNISDNQQHNPYLNTAKDNTDIINNNKITVRPEFNNNLEYSKNYYDNDGHNHNYKHGHGHGHGHEHGHEHGHGHEIIDETIINRPKNPIDLIKIHDYRVIEDPLKDPKRRLPRYLLGPLTTSPIFNYPTRGFRDTFSQQGYLIDIKASSNDQNRMLPLYGRQKWPNSNIYEYYIMIQSGERERKYDLEKYTKELYDKDEVRVDILSDRKYEVKLFKQEGMEYNPFWF